MYGLTLPQPWAWAITHAGRRLENRSWAPPACLLGHPIALHAGHAYDAQGEAWLRQELFEPIPPSAALLPRGVVVAVARVVGVIQAASGEASQGALLGHLSAAQAPWFQGPYAWLLGEVTPLPTPVPCLGRKRLWNLSREVHEAVVEQWGKASESP